MGKVTVFDDDSNEYEITYKITAHRVYSDYKKKTLLQLRKEVEIKFIDMIHKENYKKFKTPIKESELPIETLEQIQAQVIEEVESFNEHGTIIIIKPK